MPNSADTQQVHTGQSEAENHLTGFLLPANWTRPDIEKRILLEKQVLCSVAGYQKKKDETLVNSTNFIIYASCLLFMILCLTPSLVLRVQSQVDEVIDVMQENISKVIERGERLDDLQDKSGTWDSVCLCVCAYAKCVFC